MVLSKKPLSVKMDVTQCLVFSYELYNVVTGQKNVQLLMYAVTVSIITIMKILSRVNKFGKIVGTYFLTVKATLPSVNY